MSMRKLFAPLVRRIGPFGIGRKLTLGFGALAGMTLLVVALGFVAGHNATEDIRGAEGQRAPASLASAQAQASLLRMQLHVRGYLVLSDPLDVEEYYNARQAFEKSLATLQAMSGGWPDEEARWVAALTATYAGWVRLPPHLFELHDNPLKNRPALRLARVDVQALRIRILDTIDAMIRIQQKRGLSASHRGLLADLLGFQNSFDAMATNLMAYGVSGELNFKLTYGPQLATNAAIWNALSGKRHLLTREQQAGLDAIAHERAKFGELALQIFSILNGEHAYEDLYLYRTEVVPQAEVLLGLLGKVNAHQQARLQADLARARNSLADARRETVAGGLLAVIFSVVLAFVFRRNIVAPVRRLTGVAEQVAAGNLASRAAVESRDEIGVLASSINIMTQRLAETIAHLQTVFAEARRARDAAEAANRAKSTFLATMSHELRTPLNGILGYAQILRRDKTLDERQSQGLTVIQQSGEHLLMLINDILDLAKIEAGKMELYPADIQLRGFLRTIAEMISVKAAQKGLDFVCDPAPDLPARVCVDAKRLRQVLLNLLSNAVKFTDKGEVRLTVRKAAGARLRFEVKDTGIGIGEDRQQALFQPFEQACDMQYRFGGTGLGLAISRQFVRLMDSDIQVESRVGLGSTFWFEVELPSKEAVLTWEETRDNVTGYKGPRKKVLVVDDIAENRAVVAGMLSRLGFDVIEAANGREGLERAQSQWPDLILMDIVMPDMDGLEVARRLRGQPAFREVPIIAISASASDADLKKSLEVGMDAFLPKPIEFDRLVSRIGVLLKLDWIYDLPQEKLVAQDGEAHRVIAPPEQEMEELLRLARLGNMQDILRWANNIAELDERYRPFVAQLRLLAKGYQSKAILNLVERHLAGKELS